MRRHPTQQQIREAEARLAASRERTRESMAQLRTTINAKLAQPSTLAWAAGIGIAIGKMLSAHKRRPATVRNEIAAGGIVAALLSRFGWRFLVDSLLQLWSSRDRWTQPAAGDTRVASRTASDTVH